jgi:phosphoglycerate dehydrogenase-like enzyme
MRPDMTSYVHEVLAGRLAPRRLDPGEPPRGPALLVIAPHEIPAAQAAELARQPWSWIHLTSAGVDFFPVRTVPAGTIITRSGGAYVAPITEYVTRALLRASSAPGWPAGELPGAPPPGQAAAGLYRRRLGVAGLGRTGQGVARLGLLLGMRVTALVRPGTGRRLPGVEQVTCVRELREVDHLVLTLPLTAATRHLLDAEFFRHCRPGLHLVNTARGPLVDHDALAAAAAGRAVTATLDVTEPEPLPDDHPLRSLPGVTITPHVAWRSGTSDSAFLDDLLANLERWPLGLPLRDRVIRSRGY